MKPFVSPRLEQYAARLTALVIMCVVLVLAAFWLQGGNQSEPDERLAQLDRLRAVAAYRPKLEAPDGTDSAAAFAGVFLPDGPPAVVSANLLDLLKQMAAMQGIEVLQAEALPPRPVEGLVLVGGKLQMVGQMPAVLNLLKAVEETELALVTEKLLLRNTRPGGDEASETYLSVELQIYGALRAAPQVAGQDG
jgi:Type II secretion system (T2SS), protein M subtype b